MADKLKVYDDDTGEGWCIGWALESEDGAIELTLGEMYESTDELTRQLSKQIDPSNREANVAELTARSLDRSCTKYGQRIYWETRKEATEALKAIKGTIQADKLVQKAAKPMPEWAKTALANGWKPPKGWKP